jgi:hypothetical protein
MEQLDRRAYLGARIALELFAGSLGCSADAIAAPPALPLPPAGRAYRDWSLQLKHVPNNRCACGQVISHNRTECKACADPVC